MKHLLKLLVMLLLLCTSQEGFSFSGHISADTSWSDSVIVTGHVWVDAGVTLVINSGVKIKFVKLTPRNHFYINGTVLAQGTSEAPIYFTSYESSPAHGDWVGVDLTTNSQNSSFQHCIIEYAEAGVTIHNHSHHHTFNRCIIRDNQTYGMHLKHAHYIDIFRTRILENGSHGIVLNESDYITIDKRCFVCDNGGDGINIRITYPGVHNTVIKGNGGSGVVLRENTTLIDMQNCEVRENHKWGLNWSKDAGGNVIHTNIIGHRGNGIVCWMDTATGSGVTPTINYNNIYENGSLPIMSVPSELYLNSPPGGFEGQSPCWKAEIPVTAAYIRFYNQNGSKKWSRLWKRDPQTANASYILWNNIGTSGTHTAIMTIACEPMLWTDFGAFSSNYTSWIAVDSVKLGTQHELFRSNDNTDIVDARYNWWGQITSVDTLIYQLVPGTVDYSGFQTSPVSNAGVLNQLPVADAGTDKDSIDVGTLVTLDGSGTSDPDTDLIYCHWSQSPSNPIYVVLSDSIGYSAIHPTFTPDRGGDYIFILTVDDGIGTSNPDSVKVQVNFRAPDTFSLSLPNNGVTVTTLTPTFVWKNTSDPDIGDSFTFTLWYSTDSTFATYTEVSGLTGTNHTPTTPLSDDTTYYWKVKAIDTHSLERWSNETWKFTTQQFGAEETLILPIPKVFEIDQNAPNPFIRTTEIEYGVPKDANVNIAVYNLSGQKIATLIEGNRKAGYHSVNWNGKDDSGKRVAKGIYFYRMEAGKFKATRKLTILK